MIVRGPHPRRHFVILNNDTVRDRQLSFRARGLLAFLLSQPPGYSTSAARLADETTEGRDAVLAALAELETARYLSRATLRDEAGRFVPNSVVYDEPQSDDGIPGPGNPLPVPPAETHKSAGHTVPWKTGAGFPGHKREVLRAEELEELPTRDVFQPRTPQQAPEHLAPAAAYHAPWVRPPDPTDCVNLLGAIAKLRAGRQQLLPPTG